jgi:5-formyltetrahydrofolate cyclo-ligase
MADKARRRAMVLDVRRSLPAPTWEREAGLLADGVVAACALASVPSGATVCAYVPLRTEPGSTAMLDVLRAGGRRVLIPIVPDGPGALGWAPYLGPGSLVAGSLGILRPTGADLGPSAIDEAALVLVPALAVDRRGVRLGRGGGWYDRSLILARAGTALLAVVRDEEVVDALPREPHDVPVTGVLTPTAGPRLFRPGLD